MTYHPQERGGGDTYHSEWRQTPHASNSPNGALLAKAHHKGWLDNDGTRTKDMVLINDHGLPLRAYFPHGRSAQFTWAECQQRIYVHNAHSYHLRTIADALRDNAAHGIKTEVEIKSLEPITPAGMDKIMAQLAADAAAAYGANWTHCVIVKVLTNLGGGLPYALEVCRSAHAHAIPTMLLLRGRDRFRRFPNHHAVTYVRGSLVLR